MALTDYVIMPSADYVAACDKVRERTGKTAPIKSGDLAAEIEGIPSGGGGGGSMDGFHMVRFFNDDRTTLLYTVFVPTGAGAIYAGDTPVSTEGGGIFLGFDPSPSNVTGDMDCYAAYDTVGTLDETSWSMISQLSADGTAQNYFAVGDTKMIHIEGTVGTLAVNGDYGVYIIGFDHNEEWEGKGIHFGTFKSTVNGTDVCLIDSKYNTSVNDGSKLFNLAHWGNYNYGGWAGSDSRYDVLGSTDKAPSGYGGAPSSGRKGYDASETCATNPVAGTLMAALPSDLRAVMKPMMKYTNNTGGSNFKGPLTLCTDYLPLLSGYEIHGTGFSGSSYKVTLESSYHKQYEYYAAGNSKVKNSHLDNGSAALWWTRTAIETASSVSILVDLTSVQQTRYCGFSAGFAPIFKV